MSKKNKNKFKKQIKAQILQEMTSAQIESAPTLAPPQTQTVPDTNMAPTQKIVNNEATQDLDQIKLDLKKTTIVVIILALIIVALVILDQKYNLLLNFGNVLFKLFHIQ